MVIDILALLTLGIGFMYGLKHGILKVVFIVVAFVVAALVALKLTPVGSIFLSELIPNLGNLGPIIVFFILFTATLSILKLLTKALESSLNVVNLSLLNKLSGALIMAVLGVFLFSSLLSFCDEGGIVSSSAKEASKLYPYIEDLPGQAAGISKSVFPFLKDMFNSVSDLFSSPDAN